MILNLTQFNKYLQYLHFKMETLMHILSLVTPFCFMAVLNLKDAYLVVPIHGHFVKFLKFTWQDKTYMYVVLPFGLSSAPHKFTKHLEPILAYLRRQGIIVCMYIDDGWVKGDSYSECFHSVKTAMTLCSCVGFIVHTEKSHPTPSQIVRILGFMVNSLTMLVTLPPDKTESALAECHHLLQTAKPTIRHVAQVTGILISIFQLAHLAELITDLWN